MEIKHIETLIEESLATSLSYKDYRDEVSQMAEERRTSGLEQTEALINYTMLNDRRMKRWDKTIKIAEDTARRISNFKTDMTWLVITESWCGDAAHVIPVLNKIASLNRGIDLRLIYRDEHLDLMDQFLTNGSRSIAKVIMIDNPTGHVIATYGPRPSEATKMVEAYKLEHGQLTPEFKEDLQRWYNKDKGKTVVLDLVDLLAIQSK